MRFSYAHNTHFGNQVKSRAQSNYILYNRLADEDRGDAKHAIDIPQGGVTYIMGNIIQRGARAPNLAMVSYSAEAIHNPVQEIYVVNNTMISEQPGGVALSLHDNGLIAAWMVNNLVVGLIPSNLVDVAPKKIATANNIITEALHFSDQFNRDYHLTAASPAINAGIDCNAVHGFRLTPAFEFESTAVGRPRHISQKLDVGAYQFIPGRE
jgi:hypothetical protein